MTAFDLPQGTGYGKRLTECISTARTMCDDDLRIPRRGSSVPVDGYGGSHGGVRADRADVTPPLLACRNERFI